MKNIIPYTLAFLIFGSIACSDNYSTRSNNTNAYIDDSTFQIYIPKSILDSNEVGQGIFGYHGYALMEHYGYWFLSKKQKKNDIKILYYDGLEKFPVSETNLDNLLHKEVWDLKTNSRSGIFVSLDTTRVNSRKMGILRNVKECEDSALLITSCFIASPKQSRIYRILITCDNTETGYMLRDSIPLIIKSISFKD